MLESLLANDLYSALFAFALVLVPAIIVHEIGHYLAARAVGIRILEFGIGIPPRLTRLFRWRGTDFTLNWLPFGGFVRPLGEDLVRPLDEEESVKQHANWDADLDTDGQAVHEAKPRARIVFCIGGSAANLISAYLLLILSALLGVMQPIGATLEVIEAGAASAVRAGDRIVTLNGEPISESVELFAALAADGNLSFTIERADGSRNPSHWKQILTAERWSKHKRSSSTLSPALRRRGLAFARATASSLWMAMRSVKMARSLSRNSAP